MCWRSFNFAIILNQTKKWKHKSFQSPPPLNLSAFNFNSFLLYIIKQIKIQIYSAIEVNVQQNEQEDNNTIQSFQVFAFNTNLLSFFKQLKKRWKTKETKIKIIKKHKHNFFLVVAIFFFSFLFFLFFTIDVVFL